LAKDEPFFIGHKHKPWTWNSLSLLITSRGTKLNSLKQYHKKVLFSEKQEKLADFDVFIIDTIGILTKIYSYAESLFWWWFWESWRS
jgi:hypothetical protein